MWMLPLYLHVNKKSDDDDDDNVRHNFGFSGSLGLLRLDNYAPTSKKLEGHIASVHLSVCALHFLMHSITSEPCMLGF